MPEQHPAGEAQNLLYLGFDFGTKWIGVAVGETITATARPETTLRSQNNKPDWDGIKKLLDHWQPHAVIVGIPYNRDGSEGPMTARASRFARQLEGRFGLRVEQVNEHLTSEAAVSELKSRNHRSRADKDSVAASLILQQWLDARPTRSEST